MIRYGRALQPLLGIAVAASMVGATPSPAQEQAAPAENSAGAPDVLELDETDVLVAPIALYPDPLLVAVLQASVVPVDVIAAAQFLDAYETDKSLQPDPDWDPAVIGLVGFPTVLRAMAANMDWVEAAGDAVLDNLAEVQQSVQQDRAEFYAAGVLKSDDKQNVIVEADIIRIEPVDPQVIYLPVYDSAALVEAIRAGDATMAARPAPPSAEGAGTATDAAAQAEAAAQAAKEAAAASQQAATQAQTAAEQSAGSASQAEQTASSAPPAAQAVEPAPPPAEVVAPPAVEPAPATSYAAAPVAYAPVTYAPPVSYTDSSGSDSTWSTVGTFAGGALVGGLLGYALGDDDGDNDGWWDDDDDINIDEDDLDNYLDDRAREREDARDDWQGFAEDAREDRQTAASDRQGQRQEGSAGRQESRTVDQQQRQESRTASQRQRQEAGAGRRDERAATQEQRRQDTQGARGDRQASRDTARDDTLSQQRTKDAQARLDQRAQKSRQPLAAREATRAPSPVGATARPVQTAKRTPQLDTTGAGRKVSGVQATQPRQQAKVGSSAAKPSSAIGGPQRGQTAKKEQARGAASRQQAAQRATPQRQATRASAPSRQVSQASARDRQATRSTGPSRQASRPARHEAVKPSGGNRAAAQGNRGQRSRGR